MAEVQTHKTEVQNHKADDDKKKSAPEDMTPVPTQAEIDELSGGKDRKVEKREAPEHLDPTPTQAENDEIKAKLFGTTVEEDKKRNAEYVEAHSEHKEGREGEDLTPTPTQEENDDAKKAAIYEPEDNPGGGTDPQKAKAEREKAEQKTEHVNRRTVEANKPGASYETRAASHTPTKAE